MGITASSYGLDECAQNLSKNDCKVNLTQNPNLSQRVLTSGISNIGLGIPFIKRKFLSHRDLCSHFLF